MITRRHVPCSCTYARVTSSNHPAQPTCHTPAYRFGVAAASSRALTTARRRADLVHQLRAHQRRRVVASQALPATSRSQLPLTLTPAVVCERLLGQRCRVGPLDLCAYQRRTRGPQTRPQTRMHHTGDWTISESACSGCQIMRHHTTTALASRKAAHAVARTGPTPSSSSQLGSSSPAESPWRRGTSLGSSPPAPALAYEPRGWRWRPSLSMSALSALGNYAGHA